MVVAMTLCMAVFLALTLSALFFCPLWIPGMLRLAWLNSGTNV